MELYRIGPCQTYGRRLAEDVRLRMYGARIGTWGGVTWDTDRDWT